MTYAIRLERAIKHSRKTQAEIAELAGTTQQVVSGILTRGSKRSTYTAQLAKACGVSAEWLATGEGSMRAVAESRVAYDAPLPKDAEEIGRAYLLLSPVMQASVRTIIFHMASAQSVARWLVIESPPNPGYQPWEDAVQRAYDADIKQRKLDL